MAGSRILWYLTGQPDTAWPDQEQEIYNETLPPEDIYGLLRRAGRIPRDALRPVVGDEFDASILGPVLRTRTPQEMDTWYQQRTAQYPDPGYPGTFVGNPKPVVYVNPDEVAGPEYDLDSAARAGAVRDPRTGHMPSVFKPDAYGPGFNPRLIMPVKSGGWADTKTGEWMRRPPDRYVPSAYALLEQAFRGDPWGWADTGYANPAEVPNRLRQMQDVQPRAGIVHVLTQS